MSQSPRDTGQHGQPSTARRPAASRKVRTAKPSATTERLTGSLSKVYDLDAAAIDRITAAGLLLRVRDLLLRELDRVLGGFGTSLARFQVLAIICHEGGGLQLSEIAAQAAVHPTTLTATIDRLVRDGLIERRADPNDRRGIFAVGTPKGYELYRQARAELAAIEYGLGDVDLATVRRLLDDLDKVAGLIERPLADRASTNNPAAAD